MTHRIAMLAPISWRVPPRHYGPWEQFVSLLTEGLVARGVDVTLFATADSVTSARLVGSAPTGYSEDPGLDVKVWEALHISAVFERAAEFDLIHNSFDFLPLSYSALVETPVVTTIHGFSSERILPVYEKYNGRVHYISISDADRSERLDYLATIHHGIDMAAFEVGRGDGGYLLFFGRIHPDKGTVEAIRVARAAGLPLLIAGHRPGPGVLRAARGAARRRRPRPLPRPGRAPASAASFSAGPWRCCTWSSFDEPFGFSVVEAMACGTPVIAARRGSMPELVRPGENGALVGSEAEAAAAVEEVAAARP